MAEKCPVCESKIGGLFGLEKPPQDVIERAQAMGLYKDGICYSCLSKSINNYLLSDENREHSSRLSKHMDAVLSKMLVTPGNISDGFLDIGLITGYCVMGTGPISTVASAFTDAFGMKSNAYLEKIRLAETEALNMLKVEALKKRADAVYNVRINLAEATSGHGMIMLSASGSAVNTGKADAGIEEVWKILADSTHQ